MRYLHLPRTSKYMKMGPDLTEQKMMTEIVGEEEPAPTQYHIPMKQCHVYSFVYYF